MLQSFKECLWLYDLQIFPEIHFYEFIYWQIGAIILWPEHFVSAFLFSSLPGFPHFSSPSLRVLELNSHFSLHCAQSQWVTGFRCAALSHSGTLQVQPAAPTIDYVSWVSNNEASFLHFWLLFSQTRAGRKFNLSSCGTSSKSPWPQAIVWHFCCCQPCSTASWSVLPFCSSHDPERLKCKPRMILLWLRMLLFNRVMEAGRDQWLMTLMVITGEMLSLHISPPG